MKKYLWFLPVAPAALAVYLTLLPSAAVGDIAYSAGDGANMTGPQAAARLTAAVAGVWVGPLSALTEISCRKQATDPVTWRCVHKGSGTAPTDTIVDAIEDASTDADRTVVEGALVPGSDTLQGYTQEIGRTWTNAEMASRYTTAAAGIWRGAIGQIVSVHMTRTTLDGTPYRLHFRGVVTSDTATYRAARAAMDADPGNHEVRIQGKVE